jgi:hypothetical protein
MSAAFCVTVEPLATLSSVSVPVIVSAVAKFIDVPVASVCNVKLLTLEGTDTVPVLVTIVPVSLVLPSTSVPVVIEPRLFVPDVPNVIPAAPALFFSVMFVADVPTGSMVTVPVPLPVESSLVPFAMLTLFASSRIVAPLFVSFRLPLTVMAVPVASLIN